MYIICLVFFIARFFVGHALGSNFPFLEVNLKCDELSERIVRVTEAEPAVNLQVVHSFSAYVEEKKDVEEKSSFEKRVDRFKKTLDEWKCKDLKTHNDFMQSLGLDTRSIIGVETLSNKLKTFIVSIENGKSAISESPTDMEELLDWWIKGKDVSKFNPLTFYRNQEKKDNYLRGVWNDLKKKIKDPEDLMPEFHEILTSRRNACDGLNNLMRDIEHYKTIEFKHQLELEPLDVLLSFYRTYRDKTLDLLSKRNDSQEDMLALYEHLQPKAVLMGDLVDSTKHPWMFWRVKQEKARFIVSKDEIGRPKEKKPGANHYVEFLPSEKPEVYFKLDGQPDLQPAKEAMLQGLYRCLNIQVPQTKIMVISHLFFGKHEKKDPYVIQASEAFYGESAKILFDSPETIPNLDLETYAHQVLGAFLTNPSDGKPRNFIYNASEQTMISIDNDEVFNKAFDEKNYISTKTILYLLPQMGCEIPQSVKRFFVNLTPENIMIQWLNILEKYNVSLSYLNEALSSYYILKNYKDISEETRVLVQKSLSYVSPTCIEKKVLEDVQSTLQKIKQHMDTSHTLFDLLKKVNPLVYCFYRDLLEKHQNNRKNAFDELHQDRTVTLNSWQLLDLGKHGIAIKDEEAAVLESIFRAGDLTSLTSLSLEGHQLSVGSIQTLVPELSKLTRLKTLNVKALNVCSREIGVQWARSLGSLFAANGLFFLIDLNLENCGLSSDGLEILIPTLERVRHLKFLNLGGNEIGHEATRILDRYSSRIPSLSHFTLRNNRLGSDGIQMIIRLPVFNEKDQYKHLESLDFDTTALGDEGASKLSLTFLRLPVLKFLYLRGNGIGNQGVLKLSSGIKFLKSLEFLALSENQISDASKLLDVLKKIPSLKKLDLTSNPIRLADVVQYNFQVKL